MQVLTSTDRSGNFRVLFMDPVVAAVQAVSRVVTSRKVGLGRGMMSHCCRVQLAAVLAVEKFQPQQPQEVSAKLAQHAQSGARTYLD